MRLAIGFLVATLSFASTCLAQATYPSVASIMKQYDGNQDGTLTQSEIAKSKYARQFPRWDKNGDGKVSAEDVIAFRRRFGIAADGTLLSAQPQELKIPDIEDLTRVDRTHRPTRQAAQHSAYVLRTRKHEVAGDGYVVLTDHTATGFLEPLKRLAAHHHGELLEVKDLATLHQQTVAFNQLREKLRTGKAKYVAIAPRLESFRENVLLGMWELLSTIDDDPQIDALPGLLLASSEKAFGKLIDQSIGFRPLASQDVKPLAISQVQQASETRSLQKAGILRNQFAKFGHETPVVAIYGQQAKDAAKLPGEQVWNLTVPGRRKFVREFPAPVARAFKNATLIIMHGHGVPGMSCSVDVEGLPNDLSGKILLSGSCFSAAPRQSDLPRLSEAPGGYQVKQRDAFILRAVDNGAVVALGHQRLNSGFPHLYPVLESWMQGQTVGRAYQQLLNGLIELQNTQSGDFVIRDQQKQQKRHPQNRLLYVIIGDPALQPLEPFE